jgi:3-keto-disaccharide hydrolase
MNLAIVAASLLVSGPLAEPPAGAGGRTVRFDKDPPGQPPPGFTCARTGQGRPGAWRIVSDAAAGPSPVLAQTDEDSTGYRFPLCVLDDMVGADVDLAVRFKPVRGATDRAAGLVWRYRDPDNYYVVRANALEGNVVLYKVEKGKRTDVDPKGSGLFTYGKKADVPSGSWSTLRVVAEGSHFRVFLNGQELFQVEDATFAGPGKVGVWTKADSVTYFDDLEVRVAR